MTKYEKLQKQLKDANRVIEDLQRRIRYLEKENAEYLKMVVEARNIYMEKVRELKQADLEKCNICT